MRNLILETSSDRQRQSPGRSLVLSSALFFVASAVAVPLPADPLQRRCWLAHTAERTTVDLRDPTAVTFSNLKNGMTVRSPFLVEFGIRGMGVIPAGHPHERAGHHHLLIDARLPMQPTAKIPFSDNYRHFGKGQTGTVLELPPGRHTLRLLFADYDHRPYFVYSPEITVKVAGKRVKGTEPQVLPEAFESTCRAWYEDQVSAPHTAGPEVYLKNLRDGEGVTSPFSLSFGVAGFGVAPAQLKLKGTGHFRPRMSQGGRSVAEPDLADGRTETFVDLPRGEYVLDIDFVGDDGTILLKAAPTRVRVAR
jgi:hypothetical protein